MVKSRADLTLALADEILMGCTPRLIHGATVLDAVLDEPLVSNEDAITLLFGDAEAKLNTADRCEKAALAVVLSWLESDPRGMALVAERHARECDQYEADYVRAEDAA